MLSRFHLDDKVALITGGGGLLGYYHADALLELGAVVVLLDVDKAKAARNVDKLTDKYGSKVSFLVSDVTDEKIIKENSTYLLDKYGSIDILINNAAIDPKVTQTQLDSRTSRLEEFPLAQWELEITTGLTGAFICSKIFGAGMARGNGGTIINVSSDLGIIAPDQRLYSCSESPLEHRAVKPVTYSVIKHGIIGLTKYLATYWEKGRIRSNALCPGGVLADQPRDFVEKVNQLIPMGRLAYPYEYREAIQFLASDASSYLNGAVIPIDGGRSAW